MEEEPLPAMVTVRPSDGKVSIRLLLETRAGLALYDGDLYKTIGQIRPAVTAVKNRHGSMTTKKGFSWFYDEEEYGREQGWEPTSKAAVAALLSVGGYVEAAPNATNQGLF